MIAQQSCIRDSFCFFTTNGHFDTLYMENGASQGDPLFYDSKWNEYFSKLKKKYSKKDSVELRTDMVAIWMDEIAKDKRLEYKYHDDTARFLSGPINMVIRMEDVESRLPQFGDEPVHFPDFGYMIVYDNPERFTLSYVIHAEKKTKSMRKFTALYAIWRERYF